MKNPKRPRNPPTFPLRMSREKIDKISLRLASMKAEVPQAAVIKVNQLESQITTWPRFAAGISKQRKEEIRLEAGQIISDFNFHLSDLDSQGRV